MSAGASVLVVDDNPAFLDVARSLLEAARPELAVHTAASATAALALLERQGSIAGASPPTFILLDFYLPDMNAPVLLRRLRASSQLERVPVLVLSQGNWAGEEATARAAGATRFRVKPSRSGALRDVVISFWKEEVHDPDRVAHRR